MSIDSLTVNDLIIDALNLIDLYTEDRIPPARFVNNGIRYLNTICSEFERNNILLPFNEVISFTATINKGSYTISPDVGSDVIHTKPCFISMVQIVYANSMFPLERMFNFNWYGRFGVQNASGQPLWWNYLRNVRGITFYLYPLPSMAYTVNILGKCASQTWAITDSLDHLDPAYYEFLMHALARRYSKVYKVATWTQIMEDDYKGGISLFKVTNDSDWSMRTVIPTDSDFAGWLVSPR